MNKGSIISLIAEVIPNNNMKLIWESSDSNVLVVEDGVIQALDLGEAVVTVKINNTDIIKSCKITVQDEIIEITNIELSKENVTLLKNEKYVLDAVITPSNASNKNLIWISSNEKVVKVNNGVITAIGEGSAVVTVKTYDGGKIAKVDVVVTKNNENTINNNSNNTNSNNSNNTNSNNTNTNSNNNSNNNNNDNDNDVGKQIPVSEVSLNKMSVTLNLNETFTLNAIVYPSNASNKNLTWTSSNEKVVKVNNGVITAIGEGNAIVYVSSSNGIQVKCDVKVNSLDKIHFIGNGTAFTTFINGNVVDSGPSPSEAILLESNGKFALIDTGLSNSNSLNPNRAMNVVSYLKKVGVKELEFIIITHVHYDHMGGASYIIDNISTKKLYMKVYYANDSSSGSSKSNNVNRYNTLYNKTLNMGIYEKINANYEGKTISLGKMNVKLLATKNLQYYNECYGEDENINSIITYITVNDKKILLTGDMEPTTSKCLKKFDSSCSGTSIIECIINKNNIKNIDLLKLPHHGYSSCDINNNIINSLNTKYIVIDNWSAKVNYYYKGVQNDNGNIVGPVYSGLKSCRAKYFLNYDTSGNNKRAFYVNNNNVVFDFSKSSIYIYNN